MSKFKEVDHLTVKKTVDYLYEKNSMISKNDIKKIINDYHDLMIETVLNQRERVEIENLFTIRYKHQNKRVFEINSAVIDEHFKNDVKMSEITRKTSQNMGYFNKVKVENGFFKFLINNLTPKIVNQENSYFECVNRLFSLFNTTSHKNFEIYVQFENEKEQEDFQKAVLELEKEPETKENKVIKKQWKNHSEQVFLLVQSNLI
ncbi:HU family DNA-binding protein [Bacillus badius]|uniref:HU family DNA-binding protein n=1 Tax=Bacillus badius TaxID=1455 RepID=UPI0007B3C20E|nr:HU family DNA-binding protein [Bacillus badius]KZR59340.1 hypothetical protein A3781_13140 [Bacillus badius]